MGRATTIRMDELVLRFSRAKLRGTATWTLSVSAREGHEEILRGIDLAALQRLWVQRAWNMRLKFCISIDGEPLSPENANALRESLHHAKIWRQLGLKVLNPKEEDAMQMRSISLMTFNFCHGDEAETPRPKQAHDLCYRIPARDVVAPSGVDTVVLDSLRLSLVLKRSKKVIEDLFADDFVDYLPPTPPDEGLSEMEAILAMVDASIRLGIEGKGARGVGVLKTAEGLTARSSDSALPLQILSPSVWTPGYLKIVSTRASLLPTVAHALSHAILDNARSPTLKRKLEKLFFFGLDDAEGETDDELTARFPFVPAPERMSIASAGIWKAMQAKLSRNAPTKRLARLILCDGGVESFDEDLFSQEASCDLDAEADEEMLEWDDWEDAEEDDLLYDDFEYLDTEEDLFADQDCDIFWASESSALPEYPDDDLLLDLMLDDNLFEE